MLAFSTCWNSARHQKNGDGASMVDEILSLGFDTIELSHGLSVSLIPGIQKAFDEGKFRVCGVHNYCPAPIEILKDNPDAFEFTSHREADRERAFNLTEKSIDTAVRFGGKYVVVHLGRVPMKNYSSQLEKMAKAGNLNDRTFVKTKLQAIEQREKLNALYFQRALDALRDLSGYAASSGIQLAVESRSSYEDMPNENEMERIMLNAASEYIGYWHDFGHVQRKANISLLNHEQWLTKMSPYLIGCHLHDVEWPSRDHRVPFSGTLDFDNLTKHLKPELPIVWELSPRRKASDIREALKLWRQRFPHLS